MANNGGVYRIANKQKAIVLPQHPKLTALFKAAPVVEKNGKKFMLVPHTHDATRFFNNMKIDVPAPILCRYNWSNMTPFDAQRMTAAMLTMNKRAYVLSEIGTGKTMSALFAADFLMYEKEIKRALIIAPLSTLTAVWENEVFKRMYHRSVAVVHHTNPDKRLAALRQNADFYVINADGLRIKSVLNALATRPDIDCVIIDELAMFRNAQAERWKALHKVVSTRKYVWGMTGSPTPQAPTDAYGQVKLLTPSSLPAPYFKQFQQLTMTQITQFRWIAKPDANDIVYKAMQPSVRYTRADCVDLPPVILTDRSAALTPPQAKAYKEMLETMQVQLAAQALTTGRITAANAGVQLSKLLQISAGFAYGTNGASLLLDYKPRLDTVLELIEESEKKVIIYLPFIKGVDRLYSDLVARGISVMKVYGDTNKKDRDAIFAAFQHQQDPRVLVAHPQCMSHGLTLTAANTIVWFSPTTSREVYEQANGRVSRPGQDTKQLVVRIIETSAERKVYRALDHKGSMQAALLELFEQT